MLEAGHRAAGTLGTWQCRSPEDTLTMAGVLSGPRHAPTHSPAPSWSRRNLGHAQQEHRWHQPGEMEQPRAELNKATD